MPEAKRGPARVSPAAETLPPAPRKAAWPGLATAVEPRDDIVKLILGLPATVRLNATTQLLLSLADYPAEASSIAQGLVQQDPVFIREYGTILVSVLTAGGDFIGALLFAEQGGPERPLWLSQALTAWAEQQPELAAHIALSELEGEGFPEVAAIWGRRNPAALAKFALDLPPGAHRALALEQARHAVEAGASLDPADRTWLLELLDRIPD